VVCDSAGARSVGHVVAGSPPFDLATYRGWIDRVEALRDAAGARG